MCVSRSFPGRPVVLLPRPRGGVPPRTPPPSPRAALLCTATCLCASVSLPPAGLGGSRLPLAFRCSPRCRRVPLLSRLPRVGVRPRALARGLLSCPRLPPPTRRGRVSPIRLATRQFYGPRFTMARLDHSPACSIWAFGARSVQRTDVWRVPASFNRWTPPSEVVTGRILPRPGRPGSPFASVGLLSHFHLCRNRPPFRPRVCGVLVA